MWSGSIPTLYRENFTPRFKVGYTAQPTHVLGEDRTEIERDSYQAVFPFFLPGCYFIMKAKEGNRYFQVETAVHLES